MRRGTLILIVGSLGLLITTITVTLCCFLGAPRFPAAWHALKVGMPFDQVDRCLREHDMEYGLRRADDGAWKLWYCFTADVEDKTECWWQATYLSVDVLVPDQRVSPEDGIPGKAPVAAITFHRIPRHAWLRGWPFFLDEIRWDPPPR